MKRTNKKAVTEASRERVKRGGRRLCSVGLPADADCRLPNITITGDKYAKIEHHCGILQLTERCVKLYSRIGLIEITGKELIAAEMDDDVLMIDGCIEAVRYE